MKCPHVGDIKEAIAMGQALADVMHFDRGWAEHIFQGDPAVTYKTGPAILNNELESRWDHYWTESEKKAILAKFVMYRLM